MHSDNVEIERKFLIHGVSWDNFEKPIPIKIIQGYAHHDPDITVRIRLEFPDKAFLTFKGKRKGISTPEFEFEIPFEKGSSMIDLFCKKDKLIVKNRYILDYNFIVDVFEGRNEGLIIAEVELENERQRYHEYEFLGKEVTNDKRYTNVNLSEYPYVEWKSNLSFE